MSQPSRPRLVFATRNRGKVVELRALLADLDLEVLSLDQVVHPVPEVVEDGDTFAANAAKKALAVSLATGLPALADDSGLEVDALEGKPGVHSARWAEMNGTGKGDPDNNRTLLAQLEAVPDDRRTGRFVCVLALADPAGRIILTARDSVEGRILRSPRGSNGFGYDPLFFIEHLGRTTAELSPGEKHEVSHRGKALRRLRELMGRAGLGGASA